MTSVRLRQLSLVFGCAAAFLGAVGVMLPDGAPGSPRAVTSGIGLGCAAVGILLRGVK